MADKLKKADMRFFLKKKMEVTLHTVHRVAQLLYLLNHLILIGLKK